MAASQAVSQDDLGVLVECVDTKIGADPCPKKQVSSAAAHLNSSPRGLLEHKVVVAGKTDVLRLADVANLSVSLRVAPAHVRPCHRSTCCPK